MKLPLHGLFSALEGRFRVRSAQQGPVWLPGNSAGEVARRDMPGFAIYSLLAGRADTEDFSGQEDFYPHGQENFTQRENSTG
jgi:hypothetical protein